MRKYRPKLISEKRTTKYLFEDASMLKCSKIVNLSFN